MQKSNVMDGKKQMLEFFGLPGWPSGKKKEVKKDTVKSKKEDGLAEFKNPEDFVLTSILVSLMHVYPDISPEDAIKKARELAKKVSLPRNNFLWIKQVVRIKRYGLRAEASRLRREFLNLI